MIRCYIGLGSNLDQPQAHIERALQTLQQEPSLLHFKASSLYFSKPIGPQDQDYFFNAVAQFDTELAPLALLDLLQSIEQQHQRQRLRHWGPRTLDLDLLLYGEQRIQNQRLTVPHKEMLNRQFVLLPLQELQPDISINNCPISDWVKQLGDQQVQRL